MTQAERRKLRLKKMEYLLSQLDDDDFAIEISIQHLSGQAILAAQVAANKYHSIGPYPPPKVVRIRTRVVIQASMIGLLVSPIFILFIR